MLSRRTRRLGITWLAVSIAFVIAASALWAQLPTATILGTVKDSSGSVMTGVSLTVRNVDTSQTRTGLSGRDGTYRFPALSVGNYEVRAEHPGFQSELHRGLTLTVTQEAVVNFTMQVGQVEQTVTVTGEASLVNTTSATMGGLVNSASITILPLNGRNYADLILLQPGVTNNANKGGGGSTAGLTFISNGATMYSNNYMMDGASMNQMFGGTTSTGEGVTLGAEGIQEYKVVTNSFSAEYGMRMGSQTTIVSKSGTDSFHGSLFWNVRNDIFDARNYFDYKTALTPGRLPPFRRNNFGGSFGGPIIKNKTFFHGVYEGLVERLGLTSILTTLSDEARVDGGLVPKISNFAKPFVDLFPKANLPNDQYTYPFSRPTRNDFEQVRIDHNFSPSDTLFGRHTMTTGTRTDSTLWPYWTLLRRSRNQYFTLAENHIFSNAVFNTFRASVSRTVRWQGTGPNALDLAGPEYSFIPGLPFGELRIGDISSNFGALSGHSSDSKQNIYTLSDDVFWTQGRHGLKFGTLINRFEMFGNTEGNLHGVINFASVQDFLLGRSTGYSAMSPDHNIRDRTYTYYTFGFYIQDDFRATSRLTLNLGLRYETHTTYKEKDNRHITWKDGDSYGFSLTSELLPGPPFKSPANRNFGPRLGFAYAATQDGKTSIRGGAALLYDVGGLGYPLRGNCGPPYCMDTSVTATVQNPAIITLPLNFPPASLGRTFSTVDPNLKQPYMLQYNFVVERQLPGDMAVTAAYAGSRGIHLTRSTPVNPGVPTTIQDNGKPYWKASPPRYRSDYDNLTLVMAGGDSFYNSMQVTLVKRMSKGLQFQNAYTWSKAIDNVPQSQGGSEATQTQSNTTYTGLDVDKGVSNFNIAHVDKLSLIYTLPDVIRRGSSRFLALALNGWGASSIVTLQGGLPFSPMIQSNRSRSRNGNDRPNLNPGRTSSDITSGTTAGCANVAAGQKLGGPNLYYDPCAFSLQEFGNLGSLGRNAFTGPGLYNWDLSLMKAELLLGERARLEFRADFFNILNHACFQPPSLGSSGNPTQVTNRAADLFTGSGTTAGVPLSTAGHITQTSTSSRQIQLGLRLSF